MKDEYVVCTHKRRSETFVFLHRKDNKLYCVFGHARKLLFPQPEGRANIIIQQDGAPHISVTLRGYHWMPSFRICGWVEEDSVFDLPVHLISIR